MKTLTLKVKLLSSALIGSGEGFGALIDSDIVYDDLGLPFLPAKRLKGCLREAAEDVRDWMEALDIEFSLEVEETFGLPGEEKSAPLYFSNLQVENYNQCREWLQYLTSQYDHFFSTEVIRDAFTETRHQTAIDSETGIAKDGSLRTIRVIQPGLVFQGEVKAKEKALPVLALACANLRRLGTKRNRGFGEIECSLIDEAGNDLTESTLGEVEHVLPKV